MKDSNLHFLGCSVTFKEWREHSLKIPTSEALPVFAKPSPMTLGLLKLWLLKLLFLKLHRGKSHSSPTHLNHSKERPMQHFSDAKMYFRVLSSCTRKGKHTLDAVAEAVHRKQAFEGRQGKSIFLILMDSSLRFSLALNS